MLSPEIDAREGSDPNLAFLADGGELGHLIRTTDWSATGLGPVETWPQSLKTVTGMLLRSPLPIVLLWGKAGIMIYNDAYSVFAGGRHPQLLGSEVRKGWSEIADFNDNVMRVGLAGGTLAYKDQELTLHRNGQPEQVWMNLDYSPVIDESGQPGGVIAFVVETSDRVRAEQALREGEARLRFLDTLGKATAQAQDADAILEITTRMLGQHLGVSICAYADMDSDEDGFTIRGDWSAPGSPSIVGHYSLADFGKLAVQNLGAGLPLIINDNHIEIEPHEAATFQAIGITATICMPFVIQGRLTALMAIHDKSPRRWTANELALLREVTERSWAHIERVRAEAAARQSELAFREELEEKVRERTAALRQSEESIRTIFDTSHQSQGLLSADGRLVYANTTALAIMNARLDDIAGQFFWDLPLFAETPNAPDTIRTAVSRVASGETVNTSLSLNFPKGRRTFDFSLRPVKSETGEVIAMVPEAVETTARVKAEKALQQAQKMEAIGNLTGGIAHDFNNLLMAVTGSLELLRKRIPDDPKLIRLVENALEGARRGSNLTTRMLAFARRQDLKSERVDLRRLVFGLRELLERALGPTIAIDIEIPNTISDVEVDANQLETALLNLAVNARDAMSGKGRIVILARDEKLGRGLGVSPGRYVCLSLTDSGVGMDEDILKRATEPFFTTKEIGKGTGLGLSMVQGFAEQSGGMLVLRSSPLRGTTAEIWLPAAHAQQAASFTEPEPPRAWENTRFLSILAVDDDALVLMSTVAMLEDLGHHVTPAESAAAALKLASTRSFDLVITDHAMPHTTGTQLAVELRKAWPDLPIILATGYADLQASSGLGLQRLAKPFTSANLADAISRAIPT